MKAVVRFERIALRTTDPDGARAFYGPLLAEGCPDVSRLPEIAIARGARPHWLGWLGVDDVDDAAAAWIARGAQPLAGGVVRAPGGGLLGLAPRTNTGARADVIWHQLMAPDVDAAAETYAALCGWTLHPPLEVPPFGTTRPFAFAPGVPAVGSIASIAGRPEVHPQWLHTFRVADLDAALAAVRAAGGLTLPPATLPSGARAAACDDPQGGAFGLMGGAP